MAKINIAANSGQTFITLLSLKFEYSIFIVNIMFERPQVKLRTS